MYVNPDLGDDVIKMYGGPGNNSMTYDVGPGNDLATILGGGGYNTLTINKNDQNFTLKDYQGRVLFQSGSAAAPLPSPTSNGLRSLTMPGNPSTPTMPALCPASWRPCCWGISRS